MMIISRSISSICPPSDLQQRPDYQLVIVLCWIQSVIITEYKHCQTEQVSSLTLVLLTSPTEESVFNTTKYIIIIFTVR